VVAFFQELKLSPWQILLALNITMLVAGCFMESIAMLVIATPVLMPLLASAGIDPVHFGVIFTLNIMIGTITPPVGMVMYVVCALGKISIMEFSREIWPFFIALVIALGLVTYVPGLAMWLPNLLMPVK
jgi:TRAP-type C4-dicarboxylate transport system permease large subunit